jgi:hypothetical protein
MKLAYCLAGWPPDSRGVSNAVGFSLTDRFLNSPGGDCFALLLAEEFLNSGLPVIVSIDRIMPHIAINASVGVSHTQSDSYWSIAMQANPHALSWEALYRDGHIRWPLGVGCHPKLASLGQRAP